MASLSNDKQSQQQNRPSYTNWFNSLRRNKQKKSTAPTATSAVPVSDSLTPEPLQRSCIDLSSSVFYLKDVDTDLAGTSSTTNIYVDEEYKRRRGESPISKLCAPCCGTKQRTESLKDSENWPNAPLRRNSPKKYETLVEMPSRVEDNHLEIVRTEQPKTDNMVTLVSKRAEFLRTTTVTTTHTLVITRPVEVMVNNKGEIVAKSHTIDGRNYLNRRSNSLDCMLHDNGMTSDMGGSVVGVRPGMLASCDDLQYIDENNSTSSNNNNNNNKSNNNYFHAYNEKCQYVSQVEPRIDTNEKRPKETTEQLQNLQKNTTANNVKNNTVNSAVIMNNYKKQINDELCEVVAEMETLDVPEDCKHSNKDKQMSIGRKKFNMDPKKGIEYLVENHLLRHDPQDVAHFLYKGEGLNKTAIGDYLGEKNDFNECVLKAFVALHDFTNLILVQALRQFLWSFRLPGEAQKIDRMMECFAQRYCQLNPDIFTNTDTCYVLSFAIIMLNTSLHNPSVKDKPTVEQFISMNRGINNGGDLPRGLLESLYESIRTEPFKIPQDDGNDLMHTFFNPDKEGWLWKQGGRYKSWKRRWFILNDNCLYYFEYTTDKEPRGIIPLENISVREIQDRSKPHCFELFATGGADIIKACKTDSEGKVVEGKHTVYRMSAATEEDQLEWIARLKQSISHNPFYDILVQRKKKALSKS